MGLDQEIHRRLPGNDEYESIHYWRKNNAVHHWIETHLLDGRSTNVEEVPISVAQLIELRDACLKASRGEHDAVPTASGFFFGSTEMDSLWEERMAQTAKDITDILYDSPEGSEFAYWSWW